MKFKILGVTSLILNAMFVAITNPIVFAQQPVWQDEFASDRLDYSKWECEVNAFGGGNDELQMYTDKKENVRIENGKLIIEARKELINQGGTLRDYSSARIRTKHRGDWKYGRFDICAKLPQGQGIWPAIWMLPTDEKYGSWASSGEIDIMEYKGQEASRIHTTLHFGGGWPRSRFDTHVHEGKQNYSKDFHVYTLDWREKKIRWLIDNEEVYACSKWDSESAEFPAPFDQEFHLVLNVAVGGRFVGPLATDTSFPVRMEVDYVRVFE
jgi:beta-glucanase (GH16 family)